MIDQSHNSSTPLKVGLGTEGSSYFLYRGLPSGFQLDMLYAYSQAVNAPIEFIRVDSVANRTELLRRGELDIAVFDSFSFADTADLSGVTFSYQVDSLHNFRWAVRDDNQRLGHNVNLFLADFSKSLDYKMLRWKYYEAKTNIAELAKTQLKLSDYDDLIREHSKRIGWDWQLLASLIYQESRFNVDIFSHRGAHGLMQMMPNTALNFGYENLADPETNIRAGTAYIGYLQRYIKKEANILDEKELVNFVLASYNAGYGRIVVDCRKRAELLGWDMNSWAEVEKTIRYLTDSNNDVPPELLLGRFRGGETLRFVKEVQERYCHYKNLLPD